MSTQPEPAGRSFDRHRKWLIVLPIAATLLPLAMFEAGVRLLIEPSPYSYGKFRGLELPPLKLIPFPRLQRPDPDAPFQNLVVDGERITYGDLFGDRREDPDIGYVNEENRRSKNGWWQSNEIGARSRTETSKGIPAGLRRVVVFGDSFAAGTRLPQDATWTAQLQARRPDLDVVNLGVDGQGLGQAFLLERRMRGRIDYDVALFLFVPWHDPWRDVNVLRSLGEGWAAFTPMPRFVLDGEGLRLVPPFYPRGTMVYERDYPEATPELRAHLRAYDRFYLPYLYEPPPVISHFVLWKLIAAKRAEVVHRRIREEIGGDVDGEANEISRRILKAARDEGAAAGHRVVVAVLPVPENLTQFARGTEAHERWRRIVAGVRAQGVETIDLADALAAAPPEEIDVGYDGTHYGPRASAVIAAAIAAALP